MDYQILTTPDGSEMIVLARVDFDRLVAAADEDASDIRAAERALADDVRYPAAVVDSILAGKSPVAAWRTYRGLTQAQLARAARMSQTGIARLETSRNGKVGYGNLATRTAIAHALDVPVTALDPVES